VKQRVNVLLQGMEACEMFPWLGEIGTARPIEGDLRRLLRIAV
jgi:hypothetical protein